jgi:glyoxylase I family protein
MNMIKSIHHTVLICSNYEVSKKFYTEILGMEIIQEIFRKERNSYKLDLALHGIYVVELFSFPDPPKRLTQPEACGLRHLAFAVTDLNQVIEHLTKHNIPCENIRVDEITQKRFTFIQDPDYLPIEFYES